jgi:hypothetical protein
MNSNARRRDGKFQWEEDDIMLPARLILVVNNGDPNPPVPTDHPEFIRTMNAMKIDAAQLTARINMLRSNHPDWKGGNPMNLDKEGINQRVIDAMVKKPDYVKTHAKMIVWRREDEQ